ncbi:ornithine cyclodeaminase family protein [Dactylosporangium sp. NPDC050588]|uniref:ornithine cyclodeaminase family protein n=1 Tax=Dactylosporangium sp. NPDC050588 TaxID=3157211 RepID=UPI0033CC44BB
MTGPLILDADAVRDACGPAAAVAAITAALRAGLDPAADPPRHAVAVRAGQFLLMPSEATGTHAGIKVATVAPGNPARGLPRIQASYLLFDAESLGLVAVLDGTALTTLRTPAVSVAAVLPRLQTMPDPLRVAVFGAGPQAHGHAETLAAVLPIATVTHLTRGRTGDRPVEDVLREADVVVCATTAREPLFDAGLIRDTATVIAVGSHEPDAREVPPALCARATVVVEDAATALREAGDVGMAVHERRLRPEDLVPMRDVVTGRAHPPADRPLLFKSVGMAWQDLVTAEAVLAAVNARSRRGPR